MVCFEIGGGVGEEGLEKNNKWLKKSRNERTQRHTKHQRRLNMSSLVTAQLQSSSNV